MILPDWSTHPEFVVLAIGSVLSTLVFIVKLLWSDIRHTWRDRQGPSQQGETINLLLLLILRELQQTNAELKALALAAEHQSDNRKRERDHRNTVDQHTLPKKKRA